MTKGGDIIAGAIILVLFFAAMQMQDQVIALGMSRGELTTIGLIFVFAGVLGFCQIAWEIILLIIDLATRIGNTKFFKFISGSGDKRGHGKTPLFMAGMKCLPLCNVLILSATNTCMRPMQRYIN